MRKHAGHEQNPNSGAGGDRTHDRRIMSPTYSFPGFATCADVAAIASALPWFARLARLPLARSLAASATPSAQQCPVMTCHSPYSAQTGSADLQTLDGLAGDLGDDLEVLVQVQHGEPG